MRDLAFELSTEHLRARAENGVGWLTFDNQARRNAMKLEMQRGIVEALEAFAASDDVRVVVMHGAGDDAFMSGADISEFESLRGSAEARVDYEATVAAASAAFEQFPKPLVAMIHGYCMGWGMATALQADLRICADDSVFAIPAARLGVGFAYASLTRLVHVIGPTAAADILLTARRLDATEAATIGLVNQVVPASALSEAVASVTDRIVANAPLTLQAAKAGIRATFAPNDDKIAIVDALVQQCFRSDDYREGRQAFMEKRVPNFTGR